MTSSLGMWRLRHVICTTITVLACFALAPVARAETLPTVDGLVPTSLYDIDAMIMFVSKRQGTLRPGWEKNATDALDAEDIRLALLAYMDDGAQRICPQLIKDNKGWHTILQESPLCSGNSNCLKHHTVAECIDSDGDGIEAWRETALGLSDTLSNPICTSDATCTFKSRCTQPALLSAPTCLNQCDPAQPHSCNAFHLENVSEDRDSLIVRVHYDHSPVPATVLDLYIDYSRNALLLLDARVMPVVSKLGYSLQVVHLTNGAVRLIILGLTDEPIPMGSAIVELVFQRTSTQLATVAFSNNVSHRIAAFAPEQGLAAEDELADDALWGDAVTTREVQKGLIYAASFDNPGVPRDFPGMDDSLPALSTLYDWTHIGQPLAEKNRVLRMLAQLQRGVTLSSRSIDGVAGNGIYLDGHDDHIELPIYVPYDATGKTPAPIESMSFDMWFYVEGATIEQALARGEQLLFSHNTASENTRMGLMLANSDTCAGNTIDMIWFNGNVRDAHNGYQSFAVQCDIPLRTWTHVGARLDDAHKRAEFFVNGNPAQAQAPLPTTGGSLWQCPQFSPTGSGLLLHQQGQIDGVKAAPTDRIYLSTTQHGLYGISRMDASGLDSVDVIRRDNSSAQDPDYHAGNDKLIYSSNANDNFEIWIANGDGSSPRQVTFGFGDTARGIFARRPRWNAAGTAFVFESNAFDLAQNDNPQQRYQLYLVTFDPNASQGQGSVAVQTAKTRDAGSPALTQLNYGSLVSSNSMLAVRLTDPNALSRHAMDAHWLAPSSAGNGGQIIFNTADDEFTHWRIYSLNLPASLVAAGTDRPQPERVELALHDSRSAPDPAATVDVRVLDARYLRQGLQPALQRLVLLEHVEASHKSVETLYIKDGLDNALSAYSLGAVEAGVSQINSAALSPDAASLLVSGIRQARPVLLRIDDVSFLTGSLSSAANMLINSVRVHGMSYTAHERYYPCNWFGAVRSPFTGLYSHGFNGGLDELRVYNYLRTAAAFESTAQRGYEQLLKNDQDGQLRAAIASCSSGSDQDCPDFHVCINNQCTMRTCDPHNVSSCTDSDGTHHGVCSLLPAALSTDGDLSWVCDTQCGGSDTQCFEQQCANGPCRFCSDTQKVCIECQPRTDDYGSVQITRIEGCPDQNSYACDDGSCVSECYRFDNDQSVYTCNAPIESCRQGRCVIEEWTWDDLSPATWAGLGEARYKNLEDMGGYYTRVMPQLYPVTIQAYGVGDYGIAPELFVEGRAQGVHDNGWFVIGTVSVYNITQQEAVAHPYVLTTSHPLTDLRMRLVDQPYTNLNVAATGLLQHDAVHCAVATMLGLGTSGGGDDDSEICYRRTPGSFATMGYRVGLQRYQALQDACRRATFVSKSAQNASMCAAIHQYNEAGDIKGHLWGGYPAVIFADVSFNGTSINSPAYRASNTICSYGPGDRFPIRDGKRQIRHYGSVLRERSHVNSLFCLNADAHAAQLEGGDPAAASIYRSMCRLEQGTLPSPLMGSANESGEDLIELVVTGPDADLLSGQPLLNCSFAKYGSDTSAQSGGTGAGPSATMASLRFTNLFVITRSGSSFPSSGITENANSCFVDAPSPTGPKVGCYEWENFGATIDPYVMASDEGTFYGTLEFDMFKGFGY